MSWRSPKASHKGGDPESQTLEPSIIAITATTQSARRCGGDTLKNVPHITNSNDTEKDDDTREVVDVEVGDDGDYQGIQNQITDSREDPEATTNGVEFPDTTASSTVDKAVYVTLTQQGKTYSKYSSMKRSHESADESKQVENQSMEYSAAAEAYGLHDEDNDEHMAKRIRDAAPDTVDLT